MSEKVIVGIDTHKYTHTAVFIDSKGEEFLSFSFKNTEEEKLINQINSISSQGKDVLVALEDTEFFGVHIAKALSCMDNATVCHIPSHLSAKMRGRKNKNDKTDALYVAKLALFEPESVLPLKSQYTKQNQIKKVLKLLVKEREELSKLSVAKTNKAHSSIHLFFGNDKTISNLERKLNKKTPFLELKEFLKQRYDFLKEKEQTNSELFALKSIILKLEEILFLKETLKKLDEEIEKVSSQIDDVLKLRKTIYGCGTLTASIIVSEIGDIERFQSEAYFASYCITTPKERSSASRKRVVINKMGNKLLNKALHHIALSQISKKDTLGRKYYEKKLEEGKTKLSALRSLKRQIARKVYKTLKNS